MIDYIKAVYDALGLYWATAYMLLAAWCFILCTFTIIWGIINGGS